MAIREWITNPNYFISGCYKYFLLLLLLLLRRLLLLLLLLLIIIIIIIVVVVVVTFFMARDSSVGLATRYGLDGSGIESRWVRDFPYLSRPALGPTQPPTQWVLGLFLEGKAVGAWRWLPSSAEVKERVEIYLYFPSGSSWRFLGWTLPFLYLSFTFIITFFSVKTHYLSTDCLNLVCNVGTIF